jgi:hypothetical protein
LSAVGNAIAERMIALQALLEMAAFTACGDQLQLQRLIEGQWSLPKWGRLGVGSQDRAVRAVWLSPKFPTSISGKRLITKKIWLELAVGYWVR